MTMTMKPTVILDPGHGGRDPGAVAHGLREKDLNLKLAHKVADRLEGVKVLLTRESDIFVSLKDRVALSNRAEADLFVSLHANAGGGHGFESFIYGGLGNGDPAIKIQDIIHRSIIKILSRWDIRDRGMKDAAFYVLRYNRVPAVLLESLFIDNEREAQLWREPPFVEALAGSIADGILESLNLKNEGDYIKSDSDSAAEERDKDPSGQKKEVMVAHGKEKDILYTVQVGAFAYPENALRCLEKARNAGFTDAFVYHKKVS